MPEGKCVNTGGKAAQKPKKNDEKTALRPKKQATSGINDIEGEE